MFKIEHVYMKFRIKKFKVVALLIWNFTNLCLFVAFLYEISYKQILICKIFKCKVAQVRMEYNPIAWHK